MADERLSRRFAPHLAVDSAVIFSKASLPLILRAMSQAQPKKVFSVSKIVRELRRSLRSRYMTCRGLK
jgi:hypothetical protein